MGLLVFHNKVILFLIFVFGFVFILTNQVLAQGANICFWKDSNNSSITLSTSVADEAACLPLCQQAQAGNPNFEQCLFNSNLILDARANLLPNVNSQNQDTDQQPNTESGTSKPLFNQSLSKDIRNLNQLRVRDPAEFIGRVVRFVVGIIGTVAFVIFIYGGVMWMTARGNSDRVAKATRVLVWGALGVVVILASYSLVELVLNAFIPESKIK